jgi:exopolysaccharide production protein ExoZ
LTAYLRLAIPDAHRAISAGLPATLLVLAAIMFEKNGGIFKNKFILLLGDSSYSLYLVHPFFAIATVAVFRRFLGDIGVPATVVLIVGCVIAACVAAVVSYLILERPITYWLKQRYGSAKRSPLPVKDQPKLPLRS